MAAYQAFFLQPVQDRIQRSLGNLERATRTITQLGRDGIAVQGSRLEDRQQKALELSLEALHTSTVYASRQEASRANRQLPVTLPSAIAIR